MKTLFRSLLIILLLSSSINAFADLYKFSYTTEGITPFANEAYRAVLTGVVDGTLQSDGDTIVVNSLLAASLDGFPYEITSEIGIRGQVIDTPGRISLSGATLDIAVCVQGWNTAGQNGRPGCDFSAGGGGFLINNAAGDLGLVGFRGISINNPNPNPNVVIPDPQTIIWAGIPDLDVLFGTRIRAGDIPLIPENWSASLVDEDGDGVSDSNDVCPATGNTDSTITILGIDSGVDDLVFGATGCSLGDLLEEIVDDCLASAGSAQFSSCTARGFNSLKSTGVITGREKGALQSAAARSSTGKDDKKKKGKKKN